MNLEVAERLYLFARSILTALSPLAEAAAMSSQSIESDEIDVDAVEIVDSDYCRDCETPEGMDW